MNSESRNEMNGRNGAVASKESKRAYQTPQLLVHGKLEEITASGGQPQPDSMLGVLSG